MAARLRYVRSTGKDRSDELTMFRALLLEKNAKGRAMVGIKHVDKTALPQGEVTGTAKHSALNRQDGLCQSPIESGLARTFPYMAGIGFAGTVEAWRDARYWAGGREALTGQRVGEVRWGDGTGFLTGYLAQADGSRADRAGQTQ